MINDLLDREKRFQSKALKLKLQNLEEETIRNKQEIEQTRYDLKKAEEREEERKKRLESIYKQDLINPF